MIHNGLEYTNGRYEERMTCIYERLFSYSVLFDGAADIKRVVNKKK